MISVSSSDARSEIGLGFGGIEEEDMEIDEDSDFGEEESTHSYVSCVDPDVALSYIDEKLENVLGHFQKDFEGGVSAENLGAKYGGYGSFLSMYQRSPACKSPPQVQNQVVGQSKCSASPSKAPPPPPASDVLVKLKNLVKSSNDSKQKPVTKTSPSPSSSAPSNHKTLKLRIKVGSKSDLSLKNVSTYNGKQGTLNMPPSTSRANGISEVEEGLLNGSPTKILMAMVSFPLHKDQLLSPLSDDLIQLGKKGHIMKDAQTCVKKENLEYHIVSDTEKEADKQSCEELVTETMKLPLLSCLSPSSNHRSKEIDKISDSYVEGTLRGMNNTDLDAPLMVSKPDLEDTNVVAFSDRSVEGTERVNTRKDVEEGEALNSPESKSKREKAPGIEHVEDPSVVKFSKSETKNEEQTLKSKLPKAQKSQKSSSRNSLRGKDAGVGITDTNPPVKLQEDTGLSEDVLGGMKNVGMEPESGTCKKPKTGKSRFSAVDQPGSNKTMTTQAASAQKVKDIGEPSPRDEHEDRKRKQKENTESGDCRREAAVMESRKEKRLKGSSFDRDRGVSQENGRDSASHQPLTMSSPSLLCKDLGSEIIVQEAKGSLVESLAPSALDPRELKSERISERDKHLDADSTAGDTRKRCREGEGYVTMDKPGTTKKAAESSKDCNEQTTHSWDKERADGENCSTDKYIPQKSGRYSESISQRKNREGGSSAPLKENQRGAANEVQDLGAAVQVKTKESRSKKRPARKVSMESNKEDSRGHQDPINKLDSNSTDQVDVLNHGREISTSKTKVMRTDNHDVGSRSRKLNGSTRNDHVGSSPLKKEYTSQAASNSIKEATDLKHIADRLKNAGNNHESIGFYFQAALKFLHGASLLESSGTENATHKSIATSKHIYGSTAKLCKFCAHEYEKDKDMGAAALAYKCMEVAYLRITYSSHGNINRYKSELESSLQVIPSGESPSFASDGENQNKTLAAEKVALSTPVRSSPKVTGNHVLTSGNNSSLSQLLTFSQNVSLAMDASRKAQTAFAVAKGKCSDTRYSSNGITSIKRALDFSFQDMEKLVHAVRLAMESINR
ncbi:unnamed protein product [Eruca vesicaria subsp. sativa]|uniref:CWZF3/5/7 THD domain-containing protein n=1 Tax=Eruca vesicaria subsp. sativa TaxID=29727 RepID=A0ABC8JQ25_ERUVS|nr:unnamed protein product [Eruca vesicaria subsp. sativa]